MCKLFKKSIYQKLKSVDGFHDALISLTLTDSIGTLIDFKYPASCMPVNGVIRRGVHHLDAGICR